MNSLQIDIVDGRTEFEPGAEIHVEVAWDFPEAPESVELRLVWNTVGKGDMDLEVVSTKHLELPSPREQRRETIALPVGPYSFSGKLISLVWALEVVVLPDEQTARREFTLGPRGQEVSIGPRIEEPSE